MRNLLNDSGMNKIQFYCKSMDKVFKVRHITTSVESANRYCKRHKDCGVIGSTNSNEIIFIAEVDAVKILPD